MSQHSKQYCQYYYCDGNHQGLNQKKTNTKPGKYLKKALTNSTNMKIMQENTKRYQETNKFKPIKQTTNKFTNTLDNNDNFSKSIIQMQNDIENVLRKFS